MASGQKSSGVIKTITGVADFIDQQKPTFKKNFNKLINPCRKKGEVVPSCKLILIGFLYEEKQY